jgi:hypothetical protein
LAGAVAFVAGLVVITFAAAALLGPEFAGFGDGAAGEAEVVGQLGGERCPPAHLWVGGGEEDAAEGFGKRDPQDGGHWSSVSVVMSNLSGGVRPMAQPAAA